MSDQKIFNTIIEKNGYNYYVVPKGYPLFKASKIFSNTNSISLILEPNKPYFFGLKNNDPDYITNYEEEYGVIFEYITLEPIELLALDNEKTMNKLYNEAPKDIQIILEKNYGFNTKSRLSESGPDRIFSNYLCEIGQPGYAIYEMDTDFGGTFHPELLICNATKYVRYVKQVTINPKRIREIVDMGKMRQITNTLEQSRKEARKINNSLFIEEKDNDLPNFKPRGNLFGDDDDDTSELNGGKIKKANKKLKKTNKKSNKKSKKANKKSKNKSNKKSKRINK